MDFPFNFITVFLFLAFVLVQVNKWKRSKKAQKLPPSPWRLPFIGNMHHLLGSPVHRAMTKLAKKHGDLMHLELGELSAVVVSSARLAKEIMKTHDLAFANRAQFEASKIIQYNCSDVACAPYGEYWRQMRKICTLELLSAKTVRSYGSIRQDEVLRLIASIQALATAGEPINLAEKLSSYTSSMVCRAAFGKVSRYEQNAFLQLIKELFPLSSGLDISDLYPSYKFLHPFSVVKPKLVKIHRKMDKLLDQIIDQHIDNLARRGLGKSGHEDLVDVLKLVIKETLRLHPPVPLLIPRECREKCEIDEYVIPVKTRVMINVWAIGRDPRYWSDPESFKPERFENYSIDFTGNHFEYLPFGAGRRICPGISFGLANVVLPLAVLLYHFNWSLPNGINSNDFDMTEVVGIAASRKRNLLLLATLYNPSLDTAFQSPNIY